MSSGAVISLTTVTYAQYDIKGNIGSTVYDMLQKINRSEDVDLLPAANVLSILAFFKREILRLTKELNDTTPPQTPEEREAAQGLLHGAMKM